MILVTGASGRIGSQLVMQLANASIPVRAFIHNPNKANVFRGLGVEVIVGDLNHSGTLNTALQGVKCLCSIPPNIYLQADMESRLFDAAQATGVQYIVKLSSVKAKVDSPCHFFKEHWLAEEYLKQSGLTFTILQSNSFMQNLFWFAQEIKSFNTFSLPMRDVETAPVDIRDVVSVLVALLLEKKHTSQTYNVTGSEMLSFSKMAEQLSIATARKIIYNNISQETFRQTLENVRRQEWYVDAIVAAWKVASEDLPTTTNVITKIARRTPITFEKFAQDHAQVFIN